MSKRIILSIVTITFIFLFYSYLIFLNKKTNNDFNNNSENIENSDINENTEETRFNSNLIKNVEYSTEDLNGNKYTLSAKEGEIDINDNSIIFLKK